MLYNFNVSIKLKALLKPFLCSALIANQVWYANRSRKKSNSELKSYSSMIPSSFILYFQMKLGFNLISYPQAFMKIELYFI